MKYENDIQHLGLVCSAGSRPQPLLRDGESRGRFQGAGKRIGHGNPVKRRRAGRREGGVGVRDQRRVEELQPC